MAAKKKLVSWNVNGIRAAHKKGFLDYVAAEAPEVLALQEVKAFPGQVEPALLHPSKLFSYWHPAKKPGYSGVATFSKREPENVITGLGIEPIDIEGRVLTLEFPEYFVVNAYFPNSQREGGRLSYKLEFCLQMELFLEKLRKKGKPVILCGDYNIAHQAIDLRNPKQNEKNAGYLPEERAWMTRHLSQGFVDVFRQLHPEPHRYTWWSYRPGVREKNIGWRIDYHTVNAESADRAKDAEHRCEVKGSDHCPVVLEWKA